MREDGQTQKSLEIRSVNRIVLWGNYTYMNIEDNKKLHHLIDGVFLVLMANTNCSF
ncbi:hypothetical protein ACVWY7_005036 [Bacillus sp. TE9106W]|uniref:hypothetical protein n=1 Tax=Bacillus cereus group TaxID=86661 RepID=UPI0002D4340B|nr:hypothetical protein [Bacillus anthracis]